MQPAGVPRSWVGSRPRCSRPSPPTAQRCAPMRRGRRWHEPRAQLKQLPGGDRSAVAARPALRCWAAWPALPTSRSTTPLWFMQLARPVAHLLDAYPPLGAWLRPACRPSATDQPHRLSSTEALAMAAGASRACDLPASSQRWASRPAPSRHGERHSTTASTRLPARWSGLSRGRVGARRNDARAGVVHVHFPRIGFQIKADKAQTSHRDHRRARRSASSRSPRARPNVVSACWPMRCSRRPDRCGIARDRQPSFSACSGRPLSASTSTRFTWRGCAASAGVAGLKRNARWRRPSRASQAAIGRYSRTTKSCASVAPRFSPDLTVLTWPSSVSAQKPASAPARRAGAAARRV